MGSGPFPYPYPGMKSSKKHRSAASASSNAPDSGQALAEELKLRMSGKKKRDPSTSGFTFNIVEQASSKSAHPITKLCKKMEYSRPKRNVSTFQLEPDEPYGQMSIFEGVNSQMLPPLTKLGGAKTQNARAAAVEASKYSSGPFNHLPTTAYNSFYSSAFPNRPISAFDTAAATGMQHPTATKSAATLRKNSNQQVDMNSNGSGNRGPNGRPVTATTHVYQFGDDFKLPPINMAVNRGPLRKPESKDKVRCRGSRTKPVTDVSRMVKKFETVEHRKREQWEEPGNSGGNASRKKQRECCENDGAMARRFPPVDHSNAPIVFEEGYPERLGKIRKMVRMFDLSAPVYQRSTTLDGMPPPTCEPQPPQSYSREQALSNSHVTFFQAPLESSSQESFSMPAHGGGCVGQQRQPMLSLEYPGYDEPKQTAPEILPSSGQNQSRGHGRHGKSSKREAKVHALPIPQSNLCSPCQSQTTLPAFLTTGKKPAWMMGDKIEVQAEVQKKWDVVNTELRDKMKNARVKSLFRNCANEGAYHDEMMIDDHGSSNDES